MSHFAELDENNQVIRVLVGNDNKPNEGYDWIIERFGGRWLKTSYNTIKGEHLQGGEPFRKNFAEPGFFYNEELDGFVPPKPFASWILNEQTGHWDPPIPKPSDGEDYEWNEETLAWILPS